MAINQVLDPSDNPETVADWQKISNIFQTTWLAIMGSLKIVSGNIQKGSAVCIGGKWYVANANTAITGDASEYVRLTASAGSVVAEYVENLTDVYWSQAWNGFYDALGRMYIFDEVKAYADGAIPIIQTIVNWRPRNIETAKILSQSAATGWASILAESPTPSGKVFTIVGSGGGMFYNYSKGDTNRSASGSSWHDIGTITLQADRGVTVNATSLRLQIRSNFQIPDHLHIELREGATVLWSAKNARSYDVVVSIGGVISASARALKIYARGGYESSSPQAGWTMSGSLTVSDPTMVDDYAVRMMGNLLR